MAKSRTRESRENNQGGFFPQGPQEATELKPDSRIVNGAVHTVLGHRIPGWQEETVVGVNMDWLGDDFPEDNVRGIVADIANAPRELDSGSSAEASPPGRAFRRKSGISTSGRR